MLRTLEEKADPRNAALIVVDVQNDFCHSEGARARAGKDRGHVQSMMPNLHRLLAHAREVQLPIVFVRAETNPAVQSEVWMERLLGRSEAPVCGDDWGAAFYEVSPQPGELVVTKHRYSAFVGTNLDVILRSKGIKSLIMTGVATNVCVGTTAYDGFQRDYHVVFVGDCCGANDAYVHESTLENVRRHFGVVVNAEEVIAAWERVRERVSTKTS